MQIQALINKLEQLRNQHGNVNVVVCGTGDIIFNEPDNKFDIDDLVWFNKDLVITFGAEPDNTKKQR